MAIGDKFEEMIMKLDAALEKTEIDDKFVDLMMGIREKISDSGVIEASQKKAEELYDKAMLKLKEAELDEKTKAKFEELKRKVAEKADDAKSFAAEKAEDLKEKAVIEKEIAEYEVSELKDKAKEAAGEFGKD